MQLLIQAPFSPHPGGMERRIKVKVVCCNKNNLIFENKVKYGNKCKNNGNKKEKIQVMHSAIAHNLLTDTRPPS